MSSVNWNDMIGHRIVAWVEGLEEQIDTEIIGTTEINKVVSIIKDDGEQIPTNRLISFTLTPPEGQETDRKFPKEGDWHKRRFCRLPRKEGGERTTGKPPNEMNCNSIHWSNPVCRALNCPCLPKRPTKIRPIEDFAEWIEAKYGDGTTVPDLEILR